LHSIPTGTAPNDKRQLSTYLYSSSAGEHITPSTNPVFLEDFHITPEQCGFTPPRRNGLSEAQAFIFEDYAANQAYKNKRRKEQFQAREDKRNTIFGRYGSTKNNHRFDPVAANIIDVSDEDTSFGAFTTSRASDSVSNPASGSSSAKPTTAREIISNTIASTTGAAVNLPTTGKGSRGSSRHAKSQNNDSMQE
jgi:hypothetical protein